MNQQFISHEPTILLIPYWTLSVEEHWTEDSRVIHPEAFLEAADSFHVIFRQLQVLQGQILFDPPHVLRLRDY